MATPAPVVSQPSNATQQADQKRNTRTRKNPARRKAAAQAKADAQQNSDNVKSSLSAAQTEPQQTRRQPRKLSAQSSSDTSPPKKPILTTPKQTASNVNMTTRRRNSLVSIKSDFSDRSSTSLTVPAMVTGGLVGCAAGAAILLGVCVWYDFSGVKSAIMTARAAKLCVDNLTEEIITSLKAGTYSTDEALDMLRRTTLAYASTIPDGTACVERIFREINMVRKQRGPEVEKVMHNAYDELTAAGKANATADEMKILVIRHLAKLSTFATGAIRDIVARNPRLKPLRDHTIRSLKQPPKPKVPTIKVNMSIRQKQSVGA